MIKLLPSLNSSPGVCKIKGILPPHDTQDCAIWSHPPLSLVFPPCNYSPVSPKRTNFSKNALYFHTSLQRKTSAHDRTWQQALLPEGKGRLPVIGGIMSAWLISYHGNQQRGMPLTAPLIRTLTSWGLEHVCRNVSQVSRV